MRSPEAEFVARIRPMCLGLPEVHEEQAWVGTRWRIRTKTFAHVLTLQDGWPPAYAKAASTPGAATLLMFRSSGDELDVLRSSGPPFFAPPWRADEVGMSLDDSTDWAEVAELITESYCVLAPAKLARAVPRPG
ncbi:MAG: MmcQ/YjbR family DNA-binding protein [Ilumatobacteraceae bacterium]